MINNYDRAHELKKPFTSMTVVLCNSTRWGGTGGDISVLSIHNQNGQILYHELGHSFGNLADEYYYPSDGAFRGYEAPNRTQNGDLSTIKWKSWLGYKEVGRYPYSLDVDEKDPNFDPSTNNWYKPHKNCAMQIASSDFCPVCESELIHCMEQVSTNLFDITEIGNNEICIDKLNITATDRFQIPDRIDGKIVSQIGEYAFANQSSCTEFILPNELVTISNYAFSGCTSLSDITLHESLTNIRYGVFSGCNNLTFTVNSNNPNFTSVDGVLYNKDESKLIQACKIPNTFIIPKTVLKISPNAFENNSNITTVRFSGNPEIGNNAFANCAHLGNVYFDTYSAPIVGVDVFKNKVPTIIVPYNAQNDFKQAFNQYSDYITSQQFAVYFISDGQVMESRSVYSGSTIENLPTQTLTGYDFSGWYDNPNYTGTPYINGDLWSSKHTITLYAKWTPKECMITFNATGGTIIGSDKINVLYDSNFTTSTTATKEGYVLDGWYDENNVQYITPEGISTIPWDHVEPYTLTAKWSIESYEIQINDDGNITWLSEDGLSNTQCTVTYGTKLNAINLIAIFKKSNQGFKEGKIFDHFEYDDSTLDWTKIPDLGENNSIITIVPIWIFEEYTIYFNTLTDIIVNPIKSLYNSKITLPTPSRTNYIFDGWYTDNTYKTKVAWNTVPDLTPTEQNNGSTQLIARWTPVTYRVYYNANGGSGTMSFTTYSYGVSFSLKKNIFVKTGHDFIGWATSENGQVVYTDGQTMENSATTQCSDINLFAIWTPSKYHITYKNLGANMFVAIDYYIYGKGMKWMPSVQLNTSYMKPTLKDFYGWYTTDSFETQVTSISPTQTGNITLYAKYDYSVATMVSVGTFTVTDEGTSNNPQRCVTINLKKEHYENLKNTTLKTLKVEVSFNLWEIDDGYQHIYLRNDSTKSTLWSTKINHSGDKKKYTYTIELELDKVKDTDTITFLFDASGDNSDTWKFDDFKVNAILTN